MKLGILYWLTRQRFSFPPSELEIILENQKAAEPPPPAEAKGAAKKNRANKSLPLFLVVFLGIVVFVGFTLRAVQGKSLSEAPNTPHGGGEDWQFQTISTRGDTGRFTDLVLDANGYPHVSFIEEVPFLSGSDKQLHYAYWDGIRWHQALVDEDLTLGGAYDYTAIVLDGNGRPHITYIDQGKLLYAYWDGTSWAIETVDDSVQVLTHPSLQLDSDDNAHISYRKGYDVAYAVREDKVWQTEIVEAGLANFNSLALAANDLPRVSYVAAGVLKYAAYNGVFWDIQTVDNSETISGPTSLALTTIQSPRIIYVASSGNLKYAYWTGKNWQTELVTTLPNQNVDVALVLDLTDTPRIVYSGSAVNIPLTYLFPVDGSWQPQILDSGSYLRVYNALALDAEGDIHVSYFDSTYDDLRYVTWDPNWIIRTVQVPAPVQATSLQLSHGNPHISYYDGSIAEIKLVGWDEDWSEIDLPLNPISNQVMQTSLAFTSEKIHMSYSVNGSLIYLVWDGQNWDVQLVDFIGNSAGYYNQILVPGDTFVRIAYWDEVNLRVKLAELASDNTWQLHTHTNGPPLDVNSGSLSATVLPGGKIGISYYDALQGHLRLAVWHPDTETWTDTLIDGTASYTGLLSALQTDGATGTPVAAYYSGGIDALYYAYQEGETWHTEPVIIEAGGITSLSLELGHQSRTYPQIVFTTSNGNLAVASKPSGIWIVEPVVSNSPTLDNVSMAFSDRAHLSFTDLGLYYAFRSATIAVEPTASIHPLPIGHRYNPLDACVWFIAQIFEPDSDVSPTTQSLSTPSGGLMQLEDEAIFGRMHMLFAGSSAGDAYVDLYIQHGAEMGQIGVNDPQLLWDAHGTLQNFLPGLEALVQGQGSERVITQQMITDALDIWQRIANVASPELASVINTELSRYNHLQDFVGMTFEEWFTALGVPVPEHRVYLPLINYQP